MPSSLPRRSLLRQLLAASISLFLLPSVASAEDQLKVAIGQINNWENQAPTLGQDAGIFKRHNLVLDNVGTQGAGETMQPVISGSADLGAGVGVAGVMRAFARGAPVRILLPAFTGTSDLYWYVKADSSFKSLKDATEKNTIAYSTSGSSSARWSWKRTGRTATTRPSSLCRPPREAPALSTRLLPPPLPPA